MGTGTNLKWEKLSLILCFAGNGISCYAQKKLAKQLSDSIQHFILEFPSFSFMKMWFFQIPMAILKLNTKQLWHFFSVSNYPFP